MCNQTSRASWSHKHGPCSEVAEIFIRFEYLGVGSVYMTMYYRGILSASPLWQWLVLARRDTEPMDTRAGKSRFRIAAQTSSKRSHASSYRVWTWALPLHTALSAPRTFIFVSSISLGPFALPCRPSTPLSGVVRRAHALAHEQGSSVSSNRLPLSCCIRVVNCKYFVLYRTYPPLVDQSREVRVRLTRGPLAPDELRCGGLGES